MIAGNVRGAAKRTTMGERYWGAISAGFAQRYEGIGGATRRDGALPALFGLKMAFAAGVCSVYKPCASDENLAKPAYLSRAI